MRSNLVIAAMAAMIGEMKSIPLINAKLMSFGKLGKTYKKKNPYDPAFAKAQAKRDRKNQLRLERMKKMKIQIKHRFTESIIFEHECENNSMRLTVELALKSRTNLSEAYLSGANLSGANLSGANLSGANLSRTDLSEAYLSRTDLSGANLSGANLSRTDLSGANLSDAHLSGTNLSEAYLSGANLSKVYLANDEKLVGARPVLQIGPIGSRCAYFTAYITDKGLRFDAGCRRQITREIFENRLAEEHGGNDHAKEYRAALTLVDAHAEIWTPKEENTNV